MGTALLSGILHPHLLIKTSPEKTVTPWSCHLPSWMWSSAQQSNVPPVECLKEDIVPGPDPLVPAKQLDLLPAMLGVEFTGQLAEVPQPSHPLGNCPCSLPWPLATPPSDLTASAIPPVGLLQHTPLMPTFSQQPACSTSPEAHSRKAADRLGERLPVIPQDFSHRLAAPGSPRVLRDEGVIPFPSKLPSHLSGAALSPIQHPSPQRTLVRRLHYQ